MQLHLRSLAMRLIILLCCLFGLMLNHVMAQSTTRLSIGPARALDVLLQDYAYRAFVQPRTGIPYDGTAPLNLTGIKISAMRLRTGSLRTCGIQSYKEFEILRGVAMDPYVERLVLVYQNLGNWSTTYYALPGYTYLTPVLGLLAYDAVNLSATNLPELNFRATGNPILIHFSDVKYVPVMSPLNMKCVWINLNGSVNFSSPISGNTCSAVDQGHFSIVVESITPAPAPVSPAPAPAGGGGGGGGGGAPNASPPTQGKGNGNKTKVWIIVGSVLGGLAIFTLSGLLMVWACKFKRRKKMQQMERATEVGEVLHMTSVGPTKAPAAMVTRTLPVLETEYVP